MKSMTRILSLALAVILVLSLCAVGAFADDAPPSAEPEGETTTEATPAPEAGTPTPAETAAPTATPAPTPTAEPSPVPTTAPTVTPAPTEAPEIGLPNEDCPSIDEPCGDGIEMGPNNPPEDGPMMFAANSNSASQYTATQMIVWEFVVGVRSTSSPYSVSDNKVINSVCYNGANSEVKTVYD